LAILHRGEAVIPALQNKGEPMALSFQINIGSVDKAKKFGSDLRDEIETIVVRKLKEFSR
jgi:hypothetical protein